MQELFQLAGMTILNIYGNILAIQMLLKVYLFTMLFIAIIKLTYII